MRHVPCGHQQVQQDLPLLCPATLFDEERQVVAITVQAPDVLLGRYQLPSRKQRSDFRPRQRGQAAR
jgi:hypothetical protein